MKNQGLILFVILLMLSSCNNPFDPGDEPAPIRYYPLSVGNEWHYMCLEADPVDISVDGLTKHIGKTYFKMSTNMIMRAVDDKVYIYKFGKEHLHLDFSLEESSSWEHSLYNMTCTILSKSDTVLTKTDTLYNCIKIACVSDLDSIVSIYAPNIGLIYYNIIGKGFAVIGGSMGLEWAIIADSTINFK